MQTESSDRPVAQVDVGQETTPQASLRFMVYAASGLFFALVLTVPIVYSSLIIPLVFLISPPALLLVALVLWLLPRHLLAAQWTWHLGVFALITLALALFRTPETAWLYALLPFSAVITIGWPAGMAMAGLVLLLCQPVFGGWLLPSLPAPLPQWVWVGGVACGWIGWAATQPLRSQARWALAYSEQASGSLEQARDTQVALKQVQDDLILANNELARLSERLKSMYQVAEEARQSKEEFVVNVSHEFRTPLNMIIGYSEMISKNPRIYGVHLPGALLADIGTINRNSQHLAKLVDDVLDLSQVEAGRMALVKEFAAIGPIIESAVQAVQGLFDSKGLYLTIECAPDLPMIICDSTRIRQVILNLLSNASRFTEQGGVRIRAGLDAGALVVAVTDTGPGIAEADQKKLFEPFQQVDGSIRRKYGGSGLGLSISRRFVEMHGGKMWLESTLGQGTTVSFRLPVAAPPEEGMKRDAARWFSPYGHYEQRARRFAAPAPRAIPRYVVLEKGDALSRRLRRFLDGAEIHPVNNAAEAIHDLARSPARALILNAASPAEVECNHDWLAEVPFGTPVLTCWVPGEEEAARRMGVVSYLVKPITGDDLIRALQAVPVRPDCAVQDVLLVEDDPELLRLFSRYLSSAEPGYRLLRATNGQRALHMMRQRKPDVVLLDLYMPGKDGYQVLREKSQDPAIADIPVIVVSSRDPQNEPIVSDTLTITRSGGLSIHTLLDCIQAVSGVLSPSAPPAVPEPPETPAG